MKKSGFDGALDPEITRSGSAKITPSKFKRGFRKPSTH
jgi:hypothetical protein